MQYTKNNGFLSMEQRIFYEESGFIVVKGLVPPEKLKQYTLRFQEICNGGPRSQGMTVMRDVSYLDTKGERAIYKLQDFQYDTTLFDFCLLPQLLDYVESFVGPDILAMHTMLISKPPDRGTLTSRHPLHQDLHYFPFRPANQIVCAWTALEPVHRGNGCLVVVPGSHKGELMPHDYPKWDGQVNKAFHGITSLETSSLNVQYVEMSAGDTVLFHPLLIHGSGANRSSGFRKAISCHYAATSVQFIDVCGTSQQNIADEVAAIVKKRFGDDTVIDYRDLWRFRARVARGRQANL